MDTGTSPMSSNDSVGRIAWHQPQGLFPAVALIIGLVLICFALASAR